MLTYFELMVIFRIQVTDRDLRRVYLAVDAAMEVVGSRLGLDLELARMAGLGVGIDAQLCKGNNARRGQIAVELLATDRVPDQVLDAVQHCRTEAVENMAPLAAALFATECLVLTAWAELEDTDLDRLEPMDLVARIHRRARIRGEPEATRCLQCADKLAVELDVLAERSLAAMRGIRGDLGL